MAWGDGQPPCCRAGLWERPGGRGLILLLLIPHTKLPLIVKQRSVYLLVLFNISKNKWLSKGTSRTEEQKEHYFPGSKAGLVLFVSIKRNSTEEFKIRLR